MFLNDLVKSIVSGESADDVVAGMKSAFGCCVTGVDQYRRVWEGALYLARGQLHSDCIIRIRSLFIFIFFNSLGKDSGKKMNRNGINSTKFYEFRAVVFYAYYRSNLFSIDVKFSRLSCQANNSQSIVMTEVTTESILFFFCKMIKCYIVIR